MSNLVNHKKEFDEFNEQRWNKILSVQHKNYSIKYKDVKCHFIDEILECFNLRDTIKGGIIRDILTVSEIDDKELVDVANLAFAVKLYKNYKGDN